VVGRERQVDREEWTGSGCQGYNGLGMGFASFITGEIGQRIITQSGLAPIREPSRNIRIRNQIENKK